MMAGDQLSIFGKSNYFLSGSIPGYSSALPVADLTLNIQPAADTDHLPGDISAHIRGQE